MPAHSHAADLGHPRPAPAEPQPRVGRSAPERATVGVDYLIEQAGGEELVLREAYRRLPRVVRQSNMLELTEAITMALLERSDAAFAQLGDHGPRALQEAASLLARAAVSASQRSI